ncbi:MAG: hypothetical protein COB32_12990 [Halomonas sp.]|nr:MAG: hypothetical protein COB32_12990 [Halomonas sp.]
MSARVYWGYTAFRISTVTCKEAMYNIYIYSFEGSYSGSSEYEFQAPHMGAEHKCILFVLQETDVCDFAGAKEEIRKFGFKNIVNLKGKPILVESLNSDKGKKFGSSSLHVDLA